MSTAERPSRYPLSDLGPLAPPPGTPLPDHKDLPCSDDTFVQNFQEHPQSNLLSDAIGPVLNRLHPDGRYAIGQDCAIYWRIAQPQVRGAVCPDWFYVPGVPPKLDGEVRRSYVLWNEHVPPLIALEFVSGDGSEERDRTPPAGKFWAYENEIRPAYYGIYEVDPGRIEMYRLVGDRFELLPSDAQGRYPIEGLGVKLGIWRGVYQALDLPWMRWYDAEGDLLPTGFERVEIEAENARREAERADREAGRADREAERADREAGRAERLAAQLRAMGIEPEG